MDEGPAEMKTLFFFAAKTISLSKRDGRKPCSLLTAARHNLREIQAELGADGRIDAGRISLNEIFIGPSIASEVVAQAQAKLLAWGVKIRRKDHVQAIEMVFSLPANWALDDRAYFQACLQWVFQRFGSENVLSAVVHRDESAPHCHVLVLPCKDGRYLGSQLIKKTPLALLRKSFAQEVAHKHGLQSVLTKGMSTFERNKKSQAVLNHLHRTRDPAVTSKIWPVVREEIQINPDEYLSSLGLTFVSPNKPKKIKTSTQIMISVGRKTSQDREVRDGLTKLSTAGVTNFQNLSSVGIEQKLVDIALSNESPAAVNNAGLQQNKVGEIK